MQQDKAIKIDVADVVKNGFPEVNDIATPTITF